MKNEQNLQSVTYARVSTKEQEESGYSLPSQEKLLKEYGLRKRFIIARSFSVSESASGKKLRETFSEMIKFANKNNVKNIICEKVDRMTRNFKDMVMIDEWLEKDGERQVHFVKDNLIMHKGSRSQEKLNWGIRMLFAKNYIDNLSEEVKKGQKEKLSQGWLPTKPPLGYKTIGEKGRKIHILDDKKAPLVKKMFKLYSTENYSLEKLTKLMNGQGLTNAFGNKVSKTQIHAQFSNPFYKGRILWKGKEYSGKHEPLVTSELWDAVQSVLHKKGTPKYSKHKHIFRGLFRCSECGGVIAWEKQKEYLYGHCNRYRPCSQKKYYRSEMVQKQLVDAIKLITPKSKRLVDWVIKALKEDHKEEINYHNVFVDELNKKLAISKNRLDKIYEDKIDGYITEEKYIDLRKRYSSEEKTALKQLANHKKANSKYYDYGTLVLEITKNAINILEDEKRDDNLKREYYKTIFSKLEITGDKVIYEFSDAFKIIAEYNSKIENIAQYANNIYELPINRLLNEKTGSLEPVHSAMLPGSDSNRRPIG